MTKLYWSESAMSFLNCSLESTAPVGLPGVQTKRSAVFSHTSAGTASKSPK